MKRTEQAPRRVCAQGDLQKIRAHARAVLAGSGAETARTRVVVGMGTCGLAAGAQQVFDAIQRELAGQGMTEQVQLVPTGCVGICQLEPVVEVYVPGQERTTYVKMTPERAVRVVQQHLRGGNPLAEFTIGARR